MKQTIKKLLFGSETREMTVSGGAGRGIKLSLDPLNNLQRKLGLSEKEIERFFVELAPKAKSYIEVGASDGYYCLLVKRFNKDLQVVGFEPEDRFEPILEENLKANNVPHDDHFSWRKEFVGKEHATLDATLASLPAPYLLKIDVDGAELDVLESGRETLKNQPAYVILETHAAELEEDALKFFHELDYKTKIIPNAWWRIFVPERRPIPHNRWLIATPPVA